MSTLWPHWTRPGWLLLLPLLLWIGWHLWQRPLRSGHWKSLLPSHFHPVLLTGGKLRGQRTPLLFLALAGLLALLALLGPSWQQLDDAPLKRADALVSVFDLSQEMLAADTPPSRLEQARRKLLDLLEARKDAQNGIVVYAGSAHNLVPLSDDLLTTRNLLEAIKPSIMPLPGRRADLGVAQAVRLLEQAGQPQGRVLLITSQLDTEEQAGIRQALSQHGNRLDILGVGSTEGAPIALPDGSFIKDEQGAILLPRLDESGLQQFATTIGGGYSTLRLDSLDLEQLGLLAGAQTLRTSSEPQQLLHWVDAGHWLLLPLLLLAACAARRGWLFCLLLALAPPQPAHAFELIDLWLTPDQQGQRLLQQQQPAAAAERFSDPRWQGLALYEAGQYAEAAARFNQGDSPADHYNRGNALARNGELEAAIGAYDQALVQQPGLAQAQQNRELVEQLLRQREQQQRQDSQSNDSPPQTKSGQTANTATPSASTATDQPSDPSAPQQPSGVSAEAETSPATDNQAQPSAEYAPNTQDPAVADLARATEAGQPPAPATKEGNPSALAAERRQELEQWLRQIPDDPAELLRRKFWYEQQQRQEQSP